MKGMYHSDLTSLQLIEILRTAQQPYTATRFSPADAHGLIPAAVFQLKLNLLGFLKEIRRRPLLLQIKQALALQCKLRRILKLSARAPPDFLNSQVKNILSSLKKLLPDKLLPEL